MDSIWTLVVAMLVVVGVLKIFLQKTPLGEEARSGRKHLYDYRRKDFLMSRAEHEFFDVLVDAVEGRYYVFPQIHLATILDNKIAGQNWEGAFRHIDEKSVDFVICDKAYIKPLLAIELDDRSHGQEDRRGRDEEVERILSGADLPLLRFSNHGSFNREEVKHLVFEKLDQ